MLLEQLKTRVATTLDNALAMWKSKLPFNGKYLQLFRDQIVSKIEMMQGQWQEFFDGGNADQFVDFLIDYAKGNLKLPPLLAIFAVPFEGMILESLRAYLKTNLPKVRDQIGTVQP
ncbi:MAG: hypothetical protein N2112_12890 [Gemmataceae bacterium]|nr:hypothetical protein [Gemmataceae bacterium]